MKIVAHSLVKNEEKWIWYSITSVINYVDEILVWDTGSTDKTVEIIKTIRSPKIKFKQIGQVDETSFTYARQAMLNETQADWVLLVDGDEVWPEEAILQTINTARENPMLEFLVSKYLNLVRDVFHYQDPKASRYKIGEYYGNYTIRAVNLFAVPGIHFGNPYGSEGFFDVNDSPIQDRKPFKSELIASPYLHLTHLERSQGSKQVMQRSNKYKYELGIPVDKNFFYPKCFYFPRPRIVPSPWQRRSFAYTLNAAWQTPLRYLKRSIE